MIERREVTLAIAAALAAGSGKPVGRGAIPPGGEPPYYLLVAVSTTLSGPPLADENPDMSVVYQVTAVTGPAPSTPGSYAVADQVQPWIRQTRSPYMLLTPIDAPIPPEGALVDVTAVHDPARSSLLGRAWLAADPGQASTVEVVRRTALDQMRAPAGGP